MKALARYMLYTLWSFVLSCGVFTLLSNVCLAPINVSLSFSILGGLLLFVVLVVWRDE